MTAVWGGEVGARALTGGTGGDGRRSPSRGPTGSPLAGRPGPDLPRRRPSAVPAPAPPGDGARPAARGGTHRAVRSVVVCARDVPAVQGMLARARWPGTVYAATSGDDVLGRLARHPADAVLVDCASVLPGCVPFVRQVRERSPRTAVVVVGADSPQLVAGVLTAGACGVVGGGRHGVELAVALARGLRALRPDGTPAPAGPGCALTDRELEVLRRMADGLTNAEIGRDLYIAEDTVKTHARRLYRKLGVSDRAHAVARAFRAGLVS